MPIAPDFTSILNKDWEINFLQCYPNGFLKYTDLCNLLQLTAAAHAEIGGISFTDMQVYGQAWVMSKMRVEIARLPQWKETVRVKTWIKTLENSRSVRCLEVYSGEEKLVGCETYWVVFNTNTRRPEQLALPFDHFELFPTAATAEEYSRIDIAQPKTLRTERKVVLSDLDIVNHTNSVKYLEWCLDQMNPSLVTNQKIKSFEMNYLKEVVLNDLVAITESTCETSKVFTVEKDGKVCFALQTFF